ncbi:hypothetical protein EV421DRAFT_1864891 [Armillaria borealis]|uniref:Secreted protein n=1 Tax=Armillaria borealis TaxID=47425 RepID=A0AA39MCF5_9AGAR|nr:hypothetical protein EV421DRAFT_1864891 [Armillaria borealis]
MAFNLDSIAPSIMEARACPWTLWMFFALLADVCETCDKNACERLSPTLTSNIRLSLWRAEDQSVNSHKVYCC